MSADASVRRHATVDRTAAVLLDSDRLSGLIGRRVRATRLRLKPGLSTIAALYADAELVGWVRVATPAHRGKIDKAAGLAERRSRRAPVLPVLGEEQLVLSYGAAETDPTLLRALGRAADPWARRLRRAWRGGELAPLRYNPQRRFVARWRFGGEDLVARVATRPAGQAITSELAERGVPVLAPRRAVSSRSGARGVGLSLWPWIDGPGDLAVRADPAAAERAGRALARLHAVTPKTRGRAYDTAELARCRSVQRGALAVLHPGLAERAARIEPRVGPQCEAGSSRSDGRSVPIHGDLSPDQVLVGADGGVWLSDFDRFGSGDPRQDLGSFLAVELLCGGDGALGGALLAGYGWSSSRDELSPWLAQAVLTRLDEPFRDGNADWAERVDRRLALVEGLLS